MRKDNSHGRAMDIQLGRNLKTLRKAHGKTQRDVAAFLNISFQQVQKYENGVNRYSAANLYKLKHYFDVPYEDFFTGLPSV